MPSQFDDAVFNQRMFAPRPDTGRCPDGAVDLELPVARDVRLHARFYPKADPRATFLVFHGNGEIVADYDRLAARYHREVDAALVVVDFRGYGRSSGTASYRDCMLDAEPALRELRRLLAGKLVAPLIALGRSVGALCAAELAAQQPALLDGLVMESAASDPLGIIRRRGLLAAPLSEADTLDFDPRVKLGRCTLPALVLHGARDQTIPPREARENFAALASAHKRLALIHGRGHSDLLADDNYYRALHDFVRSFHGEHDASENPGDSARPASWLERGQEFVNQVRARLRELRRND